jgi:hypothetical protein
MTDNSLRFGEFQRQLMQMTCLTKCMQSQTLVGLVEEPSG